MGSENAQKSRIQMLFPIIIFLLFTLGALFIILYSARTYQHIVEESQSSYNASTQSAYISQKIHAHDAGGKVYIGEIQDIPTLVMEQDFDGIPFITCIYEYEGKLRELFTAKEGGMLDPIAGMVLFDTTTFLPSYAAYGLLSIYIETPDGNKATNYISIISR